MTNPVPALRSVPAPAPAVALHRMSLANIQNSRRKDPIRTVFYGVEGLGKSTFGAGADGAIFIAAESGLSQLDVKRFPEPQSFDDVLTAVHFLTKEQHDFKTLVVDTLDWLEPLIWAHLCKRNGWDDIESPGYGKGYNAALEQWRLFTQRLERLSKERQMDVLLLAHARIKPFSDPAGRDYMRYTAALHEKAYEILKQWSDVILFGQFEEKGVETKGKVKGVSTGRRVIHTERCAAWDGKNRYGLAPTLPLGEYREFAAACERGLAADPAELRAACEQLLPQLPYAQDAPERALIVEHLAKPLNVVALWKTLNRLRVLVDQAGTGDPAPAQATQ